MATSVEGAPTGLQLDLLTVIVRLEQIAAELKADFQVTHAPLWLYLLEDRVMKCDVPRLRGYLSAETLAWEAESTS